MTPPDSHSASRPSARSPPFRRVVVFTGKP